MARLRTPPEIVSLAMKMRTEGMGIQAGRVWKVTCHDYLLGKAFSHQAKGLVSCHLQAEILQLKEMKCILAWASSCESQGWTINFLEQLLPVSVVGITDIVRSGDKG